MNQTQPTRVLLTDLTLEELHEIIQDIHMNHCNCPICSPYNSDNEVERLNKKLEEHHKLSADAIRQCDEKIRQLSMELARAKLKRTTP
jgi:hypothetical protein